MKLGCSSWSLRKLFDGRSLDLLGFVDLAAEIGLDGIEPLTNVFPSVSKKFLLELSERLSKRSVEISAISICNDFATSDPAERDAQCDDLAAWVAVAQELGVPRLRTFTGYYPEGALSLRSGSRGSVDRETVRGWVAQCYAKVLPAAERANVALAIENHSSVMPSADELLEFVMRFASASLQLNPDPTNFLPRHDELPESERGRIYSELEKIARHAVHSHLKIRDFDSDGRPANVDVPRLLAIYRKACYDGYLSFEYFGDGDAVDAVRKAVAYLRPIISR
jgi:sugar phosphate isomerase/epimerase